MQVLFTLVAEVCNYYPHWTIWIPRDNLNANAAEQVS